MESRSKHFRKRSAILDYLRRSPEHPSAEMIFAHLKAEIPDLSLGTVYRNVSYFKDQGILTSVGTVQGIERFDADLTPHVHFICQGCGQVRDLPGVQVSPEFSRDAARVSGGSVDSCRVTFYGRCAGCQGL